jgi:hypothetical protein
MRRRSYYPTQPKPRVILIDDKAPGRKQRYLGRGCHHFLHVRVETGEHPVVAMKQMNPPALALPHTIVEILRATASIGLIPGELDPPLSYLINDRLRIIQRRAIVHHLNLHIARPRILY